MGYKVIGHPRSRTIRVLWALEELGLDWEIDPDTPQGETVRALGLGGKIPALEVDGTTISDSVAILTYLADANGGLTYPPGTIERARQDSLMQFAVEEIDGPLWLAAKHKFALPEDLRREGVRETAEFEWQRGCKTLARRFGDGPFVMGEKMTIPDIVIGHCAGWAERSGFAMPEGPVADYFAAMQARPALEEARRKGDAALEAA